MNRIVKNQHNYSKRIFCYPFA
uniref:Uncharacterized protein n=1 Tax=mine drainage metagenome TaxID=410659 RepID=E6QCG7_9ZZZZ